MRELINHDDGLAARLRAARVEAGLSLRQATEGLGFTHTFLSKLELGQRLPSLAVLVALAERYETTALELIAGDHGTTCPVCGRGG